MLKKRSTSKTVGVSLAAGLALGLAAGRFIQSPKGKAVAADLKKKAALLQKKVLLEAKKVKKLTEASYNELVDCVLEAYAEGKETAKGELPLLRKELRKQWKVVRAYIDARI